jgi:hypothetical protein
MPDVVNYSVRPEFKADRDITRRDIVTLCRAISPHAVPAKFSEGGVRLSGHEVNAPGSNEIRFFGMSFGFVPHDAIVEWQNDDQVVCRAGKRVTMILKTSWHRGAGHMSREAMGKYRPLVFEDMDTFYEAFSTVGLRVKIKAKRGHFDARLKDDTFSIRKSFFYRI